MQLTYLGINLLILFVPLSLSFVPTVHYWRKWKTVFQATLPVAVLFLVWDIIVSWQDVWSFNLDYTLPVRILHLPIAEILFFFTVPFSLLFVYEAWKYHLPAEKLLKVGFSKQFLAKLVFTSIIILYLLVLILGIVSLQMYTLSLGLVGVGGMWYFFRSEKAKTLLTSGYFWLYQLSGLGGFLAINSILTSLPVVVYNEQHFSSIRIGTIPLEDFGYNFLLLSLYLASYTAAKKTARKHAQKLDLKDQSKSQ